MVKTNEWKIKEGDLTEKSRGSLSPLLILKWFLPKEEELFFLRKRKG